MLYHLAECTDAFEFAIGWGKLELVSGHASTAGVISLSAIFDKDCKACFSRCASRGARLFVPVAWGPACPSRLAAAKHSDRDAIHWIFRTSDSPSAASPRLIRYPSPYNLKSTFS